ncbi:type II toxin-antitoxin system RelE/ParE family toxin [Geothermobacter hydrogeniphilus]|uniref:Plasmid stabilization protein n=1 Tax=Geothermobacter hydrogeniphilus TaxID=1969733 RepID=A0A1X0Y288_9BACT|nr:type II toxin-antitoxin system RelE/ParE family toxin [Geothermobacter hydrogeniphilus]ORJ59280.1 plasmid stabilization protein [Geothermobacter hydrogeniphilus]
MAGKVYLTDDATHDLEELYAYVVRHDIPEKAEDLLRRIESVFSSLAEMPQRGAYPRELQELGIREFREVFYKPYRIIYRITGEDIYVMLITDGRRDMQTLLQNRLL